MFFEREANHIQQAISPLVQKGDNEGAGTLTNLPSPRDLSRIKDFLEQFCHNLGLEYHWLDENTAELQLTEEAAGLIDGPRTPGYRCKLVLSPESAEIHKDGELFMPGSYRWDRLLAIANHKGRLCRQYVTGVPGFLADADEPEAEMGALSYEPHLLIHWRLSYRTQQLTRRRILDLTVNLVTGHLETGYYQYLQSCSLEDKPLPFIPIAKRRVGFKSAYQRMADEIRYLLTIEDNRWAQDACRQLAGEIQVLEQYYNNRRVAESTDDQVAVERDMRIQELKRRSQPRVLASPFAAALLYIPMVNYQASINDQILCLRFDPVAGRPVD